MDGSGAPVFRRRAPSGAARSRVDRWPEPVGGTSATPAARASLRGTLLGRRELSGLGSAEGWLPVRPRRRETSFCERSSDPQTDVAPGRTRGRNVRSKNQCSMCPAIHTKSRSWLRSSSTREPSDPLLRVVIFRFWRIGISPSPRRSSSVSRDAPPVGGEASGGDRFAEVSRAVAPRFRGERGSSEPRKGDTGSGGPSRRDLRGGSSSSLAPSRKKGGTPFRRPGGEQAPHAFRETLRAFRAFESVVPRPGRRGGTDGPRGPRPVSGHVVVPGGRPTVMILPQVHLRKPCYDFYFL